MNVEIGTEAAQFQEKEYINSDFRAVFLILACLPRVQVLFVYCILTSRRSGLWIRIQIQIQIQV